MKESLFQSIIKRASFGYAFHEVVADIYGKSVDYRFLEVNSAFEELIGLEAYSLQGKTVKEVLNSIEKTKFEWTTFYENINLIENSEDKEFEQYFESMNKWFKVQVQSPEKGYILTLLYDITERTNVRSALKESELSYRSIFNHASDAIYIQDKQGIFLDVNKAASEMYGYTREEMVGKSPSLLSAPGLNNEVLITDSISKAFNGTPQRFEWWGKRKNGEVFPNEVTINKGVYFGKDVVFAMARDITDRHIALNALKESEEKFKSLTNQLPIGVYRTTIDGQLVFSNPALAKILNFDSSDELLNLNVKNLYANTYDREKQLITSLENDEVFQSEFQLKKKNGELIWVRDNGRLIFDKNGKPEYFDGVIEDITQRKLTEEKLLKSEARFRSLFEQTHDAVFILDLNGYLLSANKRACEMFGYDEQEITNVSFNETAEDIEKNREIMQSLRTGEKFPLYERTFRSKEGKIIYTEVAVEIVCDAVGKPLHIQSVIRDISERKQAEDALRKSEAKLRELNSTKDKFFAIISHDLKNVFTGILGITNLLVNTNELNNSIDIQTLSSMLNDTASKGYTLLENLLHWARVQTGRIEFRPEPTILNDIIINIIDMQKLNINEKNLNTQIDVEMNYKINADNFMLETVLRNLISNAIKFSNNGGKIVVEAKQKNGTAHVSISDSGIGISTDNISKLFKIETSFTTKGTNQEQGTGLGLILCKEFIDKHKGRIWVESVEGKGSTFHFTIPNSSP
jgi:PAS domain S-box-containing protein